MPVYDPEKEKSDIVTFIENMVKKVPGAEYVMPDPKDPTNFIHPLVALTRHGLMRAAYKLGVGELDKPARKEFAKAAYRTKPEWIKKIKSLEGLPKEGMIGKFKGRLRGQYDPATNKIFSEPLTKTKRFPTPFHEIAHHMWNKVDPKDKARLRIAYDDMWPKHKLNALGVELDAKLHSHEEVFAEAFSHYIADDGMFAKFPPTVREIVRKYAGTP